MTVNKGSKKASAIFNAWIPRKEAQAPFFVIVDSLNTIANKELIAKFGFKRLPSSFNLTLEASDRSMKCLTYGETL